MLRTRVSCVSCIGRQVFYPLSHQGSPMLNNTETWRKNFPEEGKANSEALGSSMTSMFEEQRRGQCGWSRLGSPADT